VTAIVNAGGHFTMMITMMITMMVQYCDV